MGHPVIASVSVNYGQAEVYNGGEYKTVNGPVIKVVFHMSNDDAGRQESAWPILDREDFDGILYELKNNCTFVPSAERSKFVSLLFEGNNDDLWQWVLKRQASVIKNNYEQWIQADSKAFTDWCVRGDEGAVRDAVKNISESSPELVDPSFSEAIEAGVPVADLFA